MELHDVVEPKMQATKAKNTIADLGCSEEVFVRKLLRGKSGRSDRVTMHLGMIEGREVFLRDGWINWHRWEGWVSPSPYALIIIDGVKGVMLGS